MLETFLECMTSLTCLRKCWTVSHVLELENVVVVQGVHPKWYSDRSIECKEGWVAYVLFYSILFYDIYVKLSQTRYLKNTYLVLLLEFAPFFPVELDCGSALLRILFRIESRTPRNSKLRGTSKAAWCNPFISQMWWQGFQSQKAIQWQSQRWEPWDCSYYTLKYFFH